MSKSDSKLETIIEIRRILKCTLDKAHRIYTDSYQQTINIIQRKVQ